MGFCIYSICNSKRIWAVKFTASRQVVSTTDCSFNPRFCLLSHIYRYTNNNFWIFLSNVLIFFIFSATIKRTAPQNFPFHLSEKLNGTPIGYSVFMFYRDTKSGCWGKLKNINTKIYNIVASNKTTAIIYHVSQLEQKNSK